MTKYPFLERIPVSKRASVINALGTWQQKKHKTQLDVVKDIRSGKDPFSVPEPVVNAPDYKEMQEIEVEKEMSQAPHGQEKVE